MSDANDNEVLREQLRALEQRVAQLEAERDASGGADQSVAANAVSAPIVDRQASPSPPDLVPSDLVPSDLGHSAAELAAKLSRSRAAAGDSPPAARLAATPPPIPQALGASAGRVGREGAADTSKAEPNKGDLERYFALTVLGRVGVAAVVLAAAYFGQLGWVGLGPGARAVLVYALGLVLVAAGALLRTRVDARYVALLWGGGIAVTYVAGALAHLRYAVTTAPVAMVSLLLTAALGQFLAYLLGLEMLASVALAGAYAAPVLVGTPSPTPTAFFVLLLSLHAWAAWTEYRFRWHGARLLAVVATCLLVLAWLVTNGASRAPISPASFALHVACVWLFLALPELLRAATARQDADRAPALWRIIVVSAMGLIASAASTCPMGLPRWLGITVSVGLLIAGAWFRPRWAVMGEWLARVPAVLASLAVIVWLRPVPGTVGEDPTQFAIVLGLAIVGIAQMLARRWTGVGELGAGLAAAASLFMVSQLPTTEQDLTLLQVPVLLALPLVLLVFGRVLAAHLVGVLLAVGACLIGLLQAQAVGFEGADRIAAALVAATAVATFASLLAGHRRSRELGYMATVLHGVLMVAWFGHCIEQRASAPVAMSAQIPFANLRFGALAALIGLVTFARARLPDAEWQQRLVLGVVVLVATYVGVLLELLDIIRDWSFGPHAAATSLYTLAFALMLMLAGSFRRVLALRWTALVVFAVVALKVAIYDLSEADTPVRVLVSGVLGAVLLAVAWGYARSQKRDK